MVDGSGLTAGQQARAAVVLWENGLFPGSFVTEEKLRAGEYALLQSGEFSWASLNFRAGRLTVEAAAAKPVPDIAAGTLHGIRARTAGTILSTNLTSGTMLVAPGQVVEAGQGLIGTARAERDGTLIFQPAAGQVVAQFDWETTQDEPLVIETSRLTGETVCRVRVFFGRHGFSLPALPSQKHRSLAISRHLQPEVWGLKLPFSVEETTYYKQTSVILTRTEDEVLTLARFRSRQALFAAYPDAKVLARKEDFSAEGPVFHYRVCYTVAADICKENT